MISKYRLMRGFLKQRLVREFVWRVVVFWNRRRLYEFSQELLKKRRESFFEYDSGDVDRLVSGVRQSGAVAGPDLPRWLVEYLVNHSKKNPCFAGRDPSKGFYLKDLKKVEVLIDRPILIAQYFNLQEDRLIERLSRDPFLQEVASSYLRVPSKLMSINMWWTFPVQASEEEKSKHAHVFHYDLDDIKFIKFFFYLTDVDAESGPHVYVKSSNRVINYENTLVRSRRFTDQEIYDAYGVDNVISVLGQAGKCLIEDTITLHKGVTPVSKPRLLIQFEYSINTYSEVSCICDRANQEIIV